MLCLETIALCKSRKRWDAKSKTEAQGLFHQIKNPMFIAAFSTAKHLFGFTVRYRVRYWILLRHTGIFSNVVKDQLVDTSTQGCKKIQKMAKKAEVKITIPRTCGRQTLHNNTNAKTPVAYFRRTLFLPFLDNLLQ